MSKRVPGWEQRDMMAEWKTWFFKTFGKTRLQVKYGGTRKAVLTDEKHLYYLDEWHGDIEVLEYQKTKGEAKHIGTYEIECDFDAKEGQRAVIKGMKLGKFKDSKKPHPVELV